MQLQSGREREVPGGTVLHAIVNNEKHSVLCNLGSVSLNIADIKHIDKIT